MKSRTEIARRLLARGIDCDMSSAIPLSLHLERDLGLSPLKLVLVALDIEAEADITLPVEELADVETVGEFLSFVSRVVAREASSDGRDGGERKM
jgi:acyl carrier protein